MATIKFTKEDIFGAPLDQERYELLLFRMELASAERYQHTYVLPLIDKRLQEIEDERNRLGLSASDPVKYAEAVRDSEEEMAEIAAQHRRDDEDRV
jgi:hypothetical protein